jgi:uncharacterized protein YkwD
MLFYPRSSVLALLAVTALIGPAQSSGRTTSHAALSSFCTGDELQVMICLHQSARRRRGLPPLRLSLRLVGAARAKGADVARCGFSHTACGHSVEYRVVRSGYRWTHVGENLAWGTGSLGRPYAIFSAWIRSPGHRANILDPTFRDLGIAVRRGTFAGRPDAAVWVAEFARH